jgi:hypothetical protein
MEALAAVRELAGVSWIDCREGRGTAAISGAVWQPVRSTSAEEKTMVNGFMKIELG